MRRRHHEFRHHEFRQFDPGALDPPSLGRREVQIRDMSFQQSIGPSVNDNMTAHRRTPSLAPPFVAFPLFLAALEARIHLRLKLLHDLCDFSLTCINSAYFGRIFLGKIKKCKRIALRADKTDQSFEAMICLASPVTNSG